MADPPSSAILNENPPRKMRSYMKVEERRMLLAVKLNISIANAYEESLAVLLRLGCLASTL
jgi:hypothetical protein